MQEIFGIAAFRSRQQVLRFEAVLRRMGVPAQVVTTPRDRAASGAVSVAGMRCVGGSAAVSLAPNGIAVLDFRK